MKRETLVSAFVCLLLLFSVLLLTLPVQAQVSFFQPPTFAGCAQFVADFNGDGKPDLLCGGSNGILYFGNGNGTFTLGPTVPDNPVAVADFNGDGREDILEQGTGTLLVLLGNGDGTFQTPVSTSSGASLLGIAAIDFNGDGKADVVGFYNGTIIVYIGNGDGTFAAGVPYNLPGNPEPSGGVVLSLGDFNGDSKPDVVVSFGGNGSAAEAVVFLGNGDGTFQAAITSTGIEGPAYAATGDFNGDGKLDLALNGPLCTGTCSPAPTTYVLLGNGDGTFQSPAAVSPGNGPLAAADVNGDGNWDIISETSPTEVQIFLGSANGTFSNASNYLLTIPVGFELFPVLSPIGIADFNGDGKLGLALGGYVLLANGDGTFQGIQVGPVPAAPAAAVVGNFINNATPDVAVVTNQQGGPYNLYILKNNGSGALSVINTYTLQQPGQSLVTGDVNGDGNLDLVVIGMDPSTQNWGYSVFLGNGDGSFQPPSFSQQSVANFRTVVLADFNNDHKLDLAVTTDNQSVAILLGNGDGTFMSPVSYFDPGSGVVVADFNGDGNPDIASGTGTETWILYGNGNGVFQAAIAPASLSNFSAAYTADINNDGKPDLISGNQVALGNADGTFTVLAALPSPDGIAGIADLNGDGKLDLIVSANTSNSSQGGVLLGNGDGTFGALISIPLVNVPATVPLIADMNGDGKPDLVFPTLPQVNGVAVLLNTTPTGFGFSTSALSPGTVTAGSSATSTVKVTSSFGFNGTVTLSCTGLPTGATCAFNPVSIPNSSGSSTLTISTPASTAGASYPVTVLGTSGSITNSAVLSLVVQAAPSFTLTPATGSPTTQIVSAGQSASFSLGLAPTGSFSGTVSLSCAITPAVTPAPTCNLSSSSVQVTGGASQTVTVTVGTTAPVTSSTAPYIQFPPQTGPLVWVLLSLGTGFLLLRSRKRLPVLGALTILLAVGAGVGCGGSSSSSTTHTSQGTPAGSYTTTVTATSGSVIQNTVLTVTVQ